MSSMFEEIDYRETPIGALSLRRRRMTLDGEDIWELKLDEGYLMSSQFVDGEVALAALALEMLPGDQLDVVIGGLGLGYTAKAALDDRRVNRLTVIELIPEVIEWHHKHVLPLGEVVASDPRCKLLEGDFFALARSPLGFGDDPHRSYDAILVDIDHSTTHLIAQGSATFYGSEAVAAVVRKLKHGGVFALWSSDDVDKAFLETMCGSLSDVRAERVEFYNPYRDVPGFNIIYLGRRT